MHSLAFGVIPPILGLTHSRHAFRMDSRPWLLALSGSCSCSATWSHTAGDYQAPNVVFHATVGTLSVETLLRQWLLTHQWNKAQDTTNTSYALVGRTPFSRAWNTAVTEHTLWSGMTVVGLGSFKRPYASLTYVTAKGLWHTVMASHTPRPHLH